MSDAMPSSTVAKRPDLVSSVVIGAHFLLVFAPVYLAVMLPVGWWLVLPWLAFGFLMNGLLNLMHEAAHYHVYRRRAANDLLGRWVLGPLAAADFDSYRQRHWDHHRHLGQPNDPKVIYHLDIRRGRMLYLVLRCLLLIEAVRKVHHNRRDHDEPAPGNSPVWLARTLVVQFLFAASLTGVAWLALAAGFWPAVRHAAFVYFFVYVYGLGSVTILAASIRAIAEHQIGTPDDAHTGAAAVRNFSCNPITRLCFGAYGFGEHATHHQRPANPYYRLRETTLVLAEKEANLAPTRGYLSTLWTLINRPAKATPPISSPAPSSR